MLAAVSLLDVILPAIAAYETQVEGKTRRTVGLLFSGYLGLYLLGGSYALGLRMAANRLSETDQIAMTWVKQNTPPDSSFVIVTGEPQLLRDPIQEWFPAWSERTSQTTLQGREWVWGDKFIESITTYQGLQDCITQNAQCIQLEAQKLGLSFEYVYIKKQSIMQCSDAETCRYNSDVLVEDLKKSPAYKLVYESNGAAILAGNPCCGTS
jgi:hypothetical protein